MNFQKEKIWMSIRTLNETLVKKSMPVSNLGVTDFCPYKKDNTPPALSEFKPYNCGKDFISFPADAHLWFHFECDVPEHGEDDKYVLKMTTGREGTWDGTNPQCSVFVNGQTCTQAFDTNHTELTLTPGHQDVYVYFYSGKDMVSVRIDIKVLVKSKCVESLIFDLTEPFEALKYVPADSFEHIESANALDIACNYIDFRNKGSEEYYASVKKAAEVLKEEYYDKLCGKPKNEEIAFIGHTHIDVAWLWTLAQTEEKAQRSFSTVIKLMEEYPEYIFMSSQPQLYAYVKKNDPELYEKIKERIKEGRWEPEGAMWLEADTNITGGESLIRQIMYGKKFMKDEFGIENKVLWLPDVFGYSAALPQILKKCGIETFFTSKINWNEVDTFPHDTFIWRGLDGSEIFAVFAKNYVNFVTAKEIKGLMDYHLDKRFTPTVLAPVGYGDGGGGVTFEMLENLKRFEKGIPGFPKVTMRRAADTIEKIKGEFEESTRKLRYTPKWSGELYLEMHRGTYTTQGANKKGNRKSELALQKAETASSIANLLSGYKADKEKFDEAWIAVLRNQFHDIIPGSSITEVYVDSKREYENIASIANAEFCGSLDTLAKGIKTDGGYLVYNPTGFSMSDIIDGKYFENIPAHGYAVALPSKTVNTVKVGEKSIENDLVKVVFDDKYHIVSIFDKTENREIIEKGKCGNVFEVFEDYPRAYDAWEITDYYKQKKWVADDVTEVSAVNGELSGGIKIVRKYNKSTFTQEIMLHTGSARVDFNTHIDWHEDHVLLKAAFPVDIRSEELTCDIQFGNLKRPTHKNTSWDEMKFEVCCHKWADLSENNYGVSLLNDCKYGYSCEENKLSITLLKAPTYPDPTADRGEHTFTYSIFPHKGSDLMATIKEAAKLNNPMTAKEIGKGEGNIPESFGFANTDGNSAVIETIKQAEDGNGYIVRIYEAQNMRENVTVNFSFDVAEIYECDMLENNIEKLDTDERSIKLKMGNFEIKTLRVIAK